jgi:hypothetical protein
MMLERTDYAHLVVINVKHALAVLIIVTNVPYQELKNQNVVVQKAITMMERARDVKNVIINVKNVKTMTENVLNVLKIVSELKNQIVIVTLLKVISILKVKKNVENATKNVKLVKTKPHVSNVLKEEKIIHQHVLVQMMNMKMLLLSIGTLLMLITGITAQNVLETGTATVDLNGFVYTPQEGGSGWNCVKYSVTLPGGVNSDIIAGVVTLANAYNIVNSNCDICTDYFNDCCAPGDEPRGCSIPGYTVSEGVTSSSWCWGGAYQCCTSQSSSGITPNGLHSIIFVGMVAFMLI